MILFIRQSSVFDHYHVEWIMKYVELERIPAIRSDKQVIEILFKVRQQNNMKKRKLMDIIFIHF